ncbi:hypothetical protein D779_2641 [Imhoffiella purpurea]|uniref:Uncharacterized protein n=1 Tax=Imhoffiella purpurea TaxID=1249627 RepID=W9VVP0_9GAMM|nr:hypothetical protein D779_2641 [Imhoffiella purpurea]
MVRKPKSALVGLLAIHVGRLQIRERGTGLWKRTVLNALLG